ncbi:MAG: imidazole glycerol phosphate synthase subunit HisF [Deltaproteobacteria bacterium]|jgi:cyclase|nr:imidazole glycerol phosphate synthase subunit HisF [Deltaproteobacteria bacterium]
MLSKRIIVCLDVRDGQLTKGVRFQGNVDIGDPVDAARRYYLEGADEIVFYDITASAESRSIMLKVVERVAEAIFIPFSVGGGISSVARMRDVLLAGAEKISVNSAAVRYPGIISDGAEAFGSQAVVLGLDAKKVPPAGHCPSGYEVVIDGGRTPTGLDALAWALKAEALGAGEICLNSIDADGTLEGYELDLTALVSGAVEIPVIASGGAGAPAHLRDALVRGGASAALVASIVHYGTHPIPAIKEYLRSQGVAVRIPGVPGDGGLPGTGAGGTAGGGALP